MAPNFLVFIVDQLNAAHLGCYGHPLPATPHIDALARRGWVADESFVATPLCMPNRASLLTGRMPSVHGARRNGVPLSLAARTFADALREAGYDTTLVGKSHLQTISGKPSLADPGRERLPLDAQRPYPGDYQQESADAWAADPGRDVQRPFYGFDHVELAIQHGDLPSGHYRRWLEREHPQALALAGRDNAQPAPEYELTRVGQAWRTRLPEELHPTHWVADRTIAHLRRVAGNGRPFLSYCSFPDPHSPYTPPGRWWNRFRPEDMVLPASFDAAGAVPPPHLAWLRRQRDEGRAVKHTMGCFAATEREVREAIALNLGGLAFIDQQVGRVLQALDSLGLAQDTVVVFTSDHGEFAGDHQLLLKGPLHYRSLVRTPLVWCDPAAGPGRSEALLSTIDVAPTILARAGVAGYNGLQGASFLPLVQDPGSPWRDSVLVEEEGQRTSYGFSRPVRMRSLLTRRHRLSLYDGADWGELYDRDADPLERHNLWDSSAHAGVRADLMTGLARRMLSLVDESPWPQALA
jgi:arylsulfatase A-like enzyme